MYRNRYIRPGCLVIAVLLLTCSNLSTQNKEEPASRIVGTVVDQLGHPLKNIFVHAVLEQTRMYMPTVNSDDAGHFIIESLKAGTYNVFGESDAAGYPYTASSFYGNNSVKVTLGNITEAPIVLILGPRAGVLRGTVLDKTTGKAIVSRYAPHFVVRKVFNREDSIEFSGPPQFRWLIPPSTDVTLEVMAEGYKPWTYADPSSPSVPLPFRLESGQEKVLNVDLAPDTQSQEGSQ